MTSSHEAIPEPLAVDAARRAAWVRKWWENHPSLGKRGGVPEVRNLCDDVDALVTQIERADKYVAALESRIELGEVEALRREVRNAG